MTKQLKNKILSKYRGSQVLKVGTWDWVSFLKKPAKEIRESMKEEGGFYNRKRQIWQFNNGYLSKHSNKDNEEVKSKYGAEKQVLSVN